MFLVFSFSLSFSVRKSCGSSFGFGGKLLSFGAKALKSNFQKTEVNFEMSLKSDVYQYCEYNISKQKYNEMFIMFMTRY